MYLHLSQASTSRLASSARRSLALQCRPAASQAWTSAAGARLRGFWPGGLTRDARRLASLASASPGVDRKSTRLNSSHSQISYAVFCLKKKKNKHLFQDYVTI